MENAGFKVDLDALNALGLEYLNILSKLTNQIHKIAGKNFNINSNQQLGEVLYDDLNLMPSKNKNRILSFSRNSRIVRSSNYSISS